MSNITEFLNNTVLPLMTSVRAWAIIIGTILLYKLFNNTRQRKLSKLKQSFKAKNKAEATMAEDEETIEEDEEDDEETSWYDIEYTFTGNETVTLPNDFDTGLTEEEATARLEKIKEYVKTKAVTIEKRATEDYDYEVLINWEKVATANIVAQ